MARKGIKDYIARYGERACLWYFRPVFVLRDRDSPPSEGFITLSLLCIYLIIKLYHLFGRMEYRQNKAFCIFGVPGASFGFQNPPGVLRIKF